MCGVKWSPKLGRAVRRETHRAFTRRRTRPEDTRGRRSPTGTLNARFPRPWSPSLTEQTDPKNKAPTTPTGRFARFTRLGSTAIAAAGRHASQALKEAVGSSENKVEERKQVNLKTANSVVDTLSQMKGAAMKVGQLLSVDPQLLPPEIRDTLGKLQMSAPPMPYATVEAVIQEAFGKPVLEVFREFDPAPIGAASIGQVHKAVSHDGQKLAVKVQYPKITDTIDSDIKNLGTVLRMAQLAVSTINVDEYLEEFRQVLHREADYLQEAESLERYAKIFTAFPGFRVPNVFKDLTRKNVLSMELIEGVKFDEHLLSLSAEARNLMAGRFLDMFMRLFHELCTLHADPHPGNFLVDKAGQIVVLDFGCVRDFEQPWVDQMTELMRAQWKGDANALIPLYTKLGFAMPARGVPDPDLLYDLHELVLEPFIKDVEFDFASWKLEEKTIAFVKENMFVSQMAPPRPALFYFRVAAGIRGMLSRTGARVNVHRMAKAMEARLRAQGR